MDKKIVQLRTLLGEFGSVLVAFSGGIDSTLLLKTAIDVLGKDKVVAVTAHSEVNSAKDLKSASEGASFLGANHIIIETQELNNSNFVFNPSNRCYFCKTELYSKLSEIADKRGLNQIVDGSNFDDQSDFRPGFQASREFTVRSPLLEAGLTKAEIRDAGKRLGLPNWDQPSSPCLCSRIPYGEHITPDKLRQIETAEATLESLGFSEFRVRHCGNTARIELPIKELPSACASPMREMIVSKLCSLGFTYVALDLAGFRSGSLNDVLPRELSYE